MMSADRNVRPSPIAGTWYSDNPQWLAREIDHFLEMAEPSIVEGDIVALIAPHAGHHYSGRTAGYAFRLVSGQQYDVVAVISPLHSYNPGTVFTSAYTSYETPLGTVPVDQTILKQIDHRLLEQGFSGIQVLSRDAEHAIEIELPFLQRALKKPFALVPMMLRSFEPDFLRVFGKTLAEALSGSSSLLVASTDLSHFYPETAAMEYDTEMLKQFAAFSPEGVLRAEQSGMGFACGAPAAAAVLWAAKDLGADTVTILHHSTSADVTGDRESVVGYGSAVIYKHA